MRVELSYRIPELRIEDCFFGFVRNLKGEYILDWIKPNKPSENGLCSLIVSYEELIGVSGDVIKLKTSINGIKRRRLYKYISFSTGSGLINRLQTLI